MSTSLIERPADAPIAPTLFDAPSPRMMVDQAVQMANVLSDVIEQKKLFTNIQGKKHVRVEAWATLGSMLGFLPREKSVIELPDGSYEAHVELYSLRSGQVVGQGSAICGVDEKRWGNAERYARRSMAITRATGKAYRLGFAWVMALAGYEGTPAEEISVIEITPDITKKSEIFDMANPEHCTRLDKKLDEMKFEQGQARARVAEHLHGKPIAAKPLQEAIDKAQIDGAFAS